MMHDHGSSFLTLSPVVLVAAMDAAYLLLAWRLRCWSAWRTALFLSGSALVELALFPRYLPFAEVDFRKHMLQHLLLGMIAPLGLVMGSPITLLLRTLPARYGRAITHLLRSSLAQGIATPVRALVLDLGGMAALYFTPLYSEMMMHPWVHPVVHLHFLAAGCLYTWVIAGPDPAPHRPSVPVRLFVLGIAVVVHSILSQMLYAGTFVAVPASPVQLKHAAVLMYYGGDISEMLLAIALVTTWRPERTSVGTGSLNLYRGPTLHGHS
jgi:putative membrane protein